MTLPLLYVCIYPRPTGCFPFRNSNFDIVVLYVEVDSTFTIISLASNRPHAISQHLPDGLGWPHRYTYSLEIFFFLQNNFILFILGVFDESLIIIFNQLLLGKTILTNRFFNTYISAKYTCKEITIFAQDSYKCNPKGLQSRARKLVSFGSMFQGVPKYKKSNFSIQAQSEWEKWCRFSSQKFDVQ